MSRVPCLHETQHDKTRKVTRHEATLLTEQHRSRDTRRLCFNRTAQEAASRATYSTKNHLATSTVTVLSLLLLLLSFAWFVFLSPTYQDQRENKNGTPLGVLLYRVWQVPQICLPLTLSDDLTLSLVIPFVFRAPQSLYTWRAPSFLE